MPETERSNPVMVMNAPRMLLGFTMSDFLRPYINFDLLILRRLPVHLLQVLNIQPPTKNMTAPSVPEQT